MLRLMALQILATVRHMDLMMLRLLVMMSMVAARRMKIVRVNMTTMSVYSTRPVMVRMMRNMAMMNVAMMMRNDDLDEQHGAAHTRGSDGHDCETNAGQEVHAGQMTTFAKNPRS